MRVLYGVGLTVLFAIGAVIGVLLGLPIFVVSLVRGARAVHAEGVICRGELIARGAPNVAGPVLVRLSGAIEGQAASHDILGLDIRMQHTASLDPAYGDQDLLLGTFESFLTAKRALATTNAGDYLGNGYSTVTPWWVPGTGPTILRLVPPPAQPADRAADRVGRLDADLAADRARFVLTAAGVELAELRLVERLAIADQPLRASMLRQGRGIRPLGARNGIRFTVYPISQLARRLRGG